MTTSLKPATSGRRAFAALFVAVIAASSGCSSDPTKGYASGGAFPEGIRTVRVPVFDNHAFAPGLEVELTEAIIKQIQATPGLKVVQSASADSELSGLITTADLRHLTVNSTTGLVQEMAYTITVDFDWIDNRTGKPIARRRGFSASDTFVPASMTRERLEAGRTGAAQRLARDIVHELRSEW